MCVCIGLNKTKRVLWWIIFEYCKTCRGNNAGNVDLAHNKEKGSPY